MAKKKTQPTLRLGAGAGAGKSTKRPQPSPAQNKGLVQAGGGRPARGGHLTRPDPEGAIALENPQQHATGGVQTALQVGHSLPTNSIRNLLVGQAPEGHSLRDDTIALFHEYFVSDNLYI